MNPTDAPGKSAEHTAVMSARSFGAKADGAIACPECFRGPAFAIEATGPAQLSFC